MKPPRTHGGKRAGAGRPPDWLKEKCQAAVDKSKLIEFITRIADGSETFYALNTRGRAVKVSPDIKDRLRAAEMLLDRGFGKPVQAIAGAGEGEPPVRIIFERAANESNPNL